MGALLLFLSLGARADLPGYYDLGPRAAAMQLHQDVDETGKEIGVLTFCHRKTLLNKGYCTGQGMPIRCRLGAAWICEEGGDYPFRAEITPLTPETVRYLFRSSFNEGDLIGTRLELPPGDAT